MDSLPKEILVHVLHFLSFKDLKSCRLVSKRFLEAATERSLWKHFVLGITRSNLSKLNKIFQLEIMKDLRNVNITGCSIKTEHVKLLIDNDITSLHLGYNNDVENDCRIDKVSVKSLATLVTKLKAFKCQNTLDSEMTHKQVKEICDKLNKPHLLSCLEIHFNNHLTSMVPNHLACALTSVSELTLGLHLKPLASHHSKIV